MRFGTLLLLMLGLSVALTGCGGDGSSTQEMAAQSPGQEVFLNNCVGCHNGGGDPPRPNNVILGSPAMASAEALEKLVRQPTSAMMPAFGADKLSSEEVAELHAYLASVK